MCVAPRWRALDIAAGAAISRSDRADRLVGLISTRRGRELRAWPTTRSEGYGIKRSAAEFAASGAGARLRAGLPQRGKIDGSAF